MERRSNDGIAFAAPLSALLLTLRVHIWGVQKLRIDSLNARQELISTSLSRSSPPPPPMSPVSCPPTPSLRFVSRFSSFTAWMYG